MIFADKLIELRKKSGWSQEELAEKLDVSRQSVSKWESAQSVPDMGRIIRLSELFGVSTDYLLKDELEALEPAAQEETGGAARTISMEEANRFLSLRLENARRIALGVMFCILSPVLLILLSGLQEAGKLPISEDQAAGLGLLVLFTLISAAVALFVVSGIRAKPFDYLERETIETLYGVDGMVRERRDRFQNTFTVQLTVGIVLCVAAVVPIFVSVILFGDEAEAPEIVAVCLMLCLIAVGVLLIVRSSIIWDGYKMLLEEGDYSREEKDDRKRHGALSGIYWGLVTAGYLAWSFLTMAWDRTWIVWPVAAVAYGAVFGIVKALRRKDG